MKTPDRYRFSISTSRYHRLFLLFSVLIPGFLLFLADMPQGAKYLALTSLAVIGIVRFRHWNKAKSRVHFLDYLGKGRWQFESPTGTFMTGYLLPKSYVTRVLIILYIRSENRQRETTVKITLFSDALKAGEFRKLYLRVVESVSLFDSPHSDWPDSIS